MHAVLDRSLFGKDNFSSLDFGVFTTRDEMRKSGHFGVDKLEIRIQESANIISIASDVYKRFVSGEEMDLRQNYQFTTKEKFVGMKI